MRDHYLTEAEFQATLRERLGLASLTAAQIANAKLAQRAGYGMIRDALMARGFALHHIDAWVRGKEFEADLGQYWFLVYTSPTEEYSDEILERLYRRFDELKTVVDVGGPALPVEGGGISHGAMSEVGWTFTRTVKW
jgi:hypothetical protein